MAEQQFLLPDLGEGLTEGEIVRWLVAVGDTVAVDQPVAEIETAKAVVEVPSPFAGTVAKLHAEEGQEVEVGKPLLSVTTGAASEPGAAPDEAEVADMVPDATEDEDAGSGNVLVGYGTSGGAARRRRGGRGRQPAAGHDQPGHDQPAALHQGNGRPLAKPPVRKLAKDLGVDLTAVAGSGPDGIVTRDDVEAYAESPSAAPQAPPHAAPQAPPHGPRGVISGAPSRTAGAAETRIPVRGVRKRIAERMTTSRREIPEATTWVDADATALMAVREELNAAQAEVRVSPLAIVLRAVVAGLGRFPEVNARLDTEANEIVLLHAVHLGVAAATDRGLVVPVIRDAHARSTLEIAAELARLAQGARAGTLKPDELVGGTFTVSNYGAFGVDGGSAVINHPEAAILGVGRIVDRPWVHEGQVAVRKVMQLSIAFDHRICDGSEAAGFLRFVADCVERPGVLLGAL